MSIKSRFLLSLSALFATGKSSSAADFCVDSAPEIQSALTLASTNNQDDVVKIVQGTYAGNFVYGSKQANKLSVLGGYTTNCANRLIDPNNTVLDGKQADRVLVLSAPDVETEFLVQGLTISNGYREGDGYNDGQGGGVYIINSYDSTVTIDKNLITGNTGGGVSAQSNTTFTNNTISNNNGGGVSAQDNSTFTNNTISNNSSSNYAGGVSAYGGAFKNNTISNNRSIDGTGGVSTNSSTTFTNNKIVNNSSEQNAGGVSTSSESTFINNTISNNSSNSYAGGVSAYGGAFKNNTISNNRSVAGTGGVSTNSSTTFTNNKIVNNSSEQNAGGVSTSSDSAFINNTIAQNRGSGVRINAQYSEPEFSFYNNLFWDNEMNEGTPNGVDLTILNADADDDYIIANVVLFGNDFDQSPHGLYFDVPQSIDPSNLNHVDPWFVNSESGDFHLQAYSPVIDAGYPDTPNLPEFDLEGNPRVIGAGVDIGAYEYNFDAPLHILTLTKTGPGTVTSSPAGINCGNNCSYAFAPGTNVTLAATPDPTYVFNRWSGACTGTNPLCTVKMDAAKTATAEFVINYPLIRGWRYNP